MLRRLQQQRQKKPSIYRKTVLEMEALLIASHALPQRLLHSSCAKYLLLVESRYDVAVTTVSKFVRWWKVLGFSCTHTHTGRHTGGKEGKTSTWLCHQFARIDSHIFSFMVVSALPPPPVSNSDIAQVNTHQRSALVSAITTPDCRQLLESITSETDLLLTHQSSRSTANTATPTPYLT